MTAEFALRHVIGVLDVLAKLALRFNMNDEALEIRKCRDKIEKGMDGKTSKFILVYGNPVSGLTFQGPFETEEAAIAYAELHDVDLECWPAELEDIEEAPANSQE
jgi:hypothetical protein